MNSYQSAHYSITPFQAARTSLFLIHWNLRQNRWLDSFESFFFLFNLIEWLSRRIYEPGGNENNQVALDVLIDIRPEEPANERNIADDRSAIFGLLHVLPDQSAEHDRLTVPHTHACCNLSRAEDRLIDNVRSKHGRLRHA